MGCLIKKRYAFLIVAVLLFVMVKTTPSTQDYDIYLHKVHGLKCDSSTSSNCFHTKNDLESAHITHLLIFMTTETHIFGEEDNKIRVLGIFNHFFVIENSLHPKSDKTIISEVR